MTGNAQTQLDLGEYPNPHTQAAPRLLTGDDVETRGTLAAWATFSACGTYRYVLGRVWDDHGALLVVCMLNPSSATEEMLDPTLRRVRGFAHRDRYGGFVVVNCFALRSADPRDVVQSLRKRTDPVGPRNDEAIRAASDPPLGLLVAGWGRPANKAVNQRMTQVRGLGLRRPFYTFGPRTSGGYPRHPLYLRKDAPIIPWTGRWGQ